MYRRSEEREKKHVPAAGVALGAPTENVKSAADWMAIERNYAPAHKIRALRKNSRQRRDYCVTGHEDVLESDGFSGRTDQPQHHRRHRFVEREFERGRRQRHYCAIGRLTADQRGVCLDLGWMYPRGEERE